MTNHRVPIDLVVVGQLLVEVALGPGGQVSLGDVVDLELVQAEQFAHREAMKITQDCAQGRCLVSQMAQQPRFVITFDEVDLRFRAGFTQRLEDVVVGELDPADHIPLSRVDRVLAELRKVEDVAVEHDHIGLRTRGRIDQHAQEERVDLLVVQVGRDQKRFEATGLFAHVLLAPVLAVRS